MDTCECTATYQHSRCIRKKVSDLHPATFNSHILYMPCNRAMQSFCTDSYIISVMSLICPEVSLTGVGHVTADCLQPLTDSSILFLLQCCSNNTSVWNATLVQTNLQGYHSDQHMLPNQVCRVWYRKRESEPNKPRSLEICPQMRQHLQQVSIIQWWHWLW